MSKTRDDMENLVSLYQEYNKSSLDYNHLVCIECNAWLTKPVYLAGDGHICEECYTTSEEYYMQNMALESLLEGGKYPCKFNKFGCKVYEELIQSHEEVCKHNRRCFCYQLVGSQKDLIEHLREKHSMNTNLLEKPVFEKALAPPKTCNFTYGTYAIDYLHAGATKLILQISMRKEGSFYKMGFHLYDAGEISRDIKFLVKLTYGETEYTKNGTASTSFLEMDDSTIVNIINVTENNGSNINYKIYFDNYQNFEPIEKHFAAMLKEYECPICMEIIEDNCYQCTNGHNICKNCNKKISTCPTCRLHINAQAVNLRSAMAHIQKLCKYSSNGCFIHGHVNDIQKHEKICPMKLKSCEVCVKQYPVVDRMFDKPDLFDHMLKEHNMQILEGYPMTVKPGFITWKGCVFKFEFTISDYIVTPVNSSSQSSVQQTVTHRQAHWCVCLIDAPKASGFYSYKLEMEICGRIITVNGIVQDDKKMETIFYPQIDKGTTPKLQLSFAVTEELRIYKLFSTPYVPYVRHVGNTCSTITSRSTSPSPLTLSMWPPLPSPPTLDTCLLTPTVPLPSSLLDHLDTGTYSGEPSFSSPALYGRAPP